MAVRAMATAMGTLIMISTSNTKKIINVSMSLFFLTGTCPASPTL